MTIAETARRYVDRLRALAERYLAAMPGEDGESPPTLQARLRARFHRYIRVIGGFFISIVVLGAAAVFAMEYASRVSLDPNVAIAAPAKGAQGLAAAGYLFRMSAEGDDDIASDRIFAPGSLRRREMSAFHAAGGVAKAYVALLRVERGARDPLVAAARRAADENGGRAAADALTRLNAAVAADDIVIDKGPAAFRALAAEASASCAARAAYLADRAREEGRETLEDEAAFHEARGEAYAWLIILRAAAKDSGSPDIQADPAFFRARVALERAAVYRPIFFLSGVRSGPLSRNHLAVVGLDLAVAAQETRALSTPSR